jgi:hypothetical protein
VSVQFVTALLYYLIGHSQGDRTLIFVIIMIYTDHFKS